MGIAQDKMAVLMNVFVSFEDDAEFFEFDFTKGGKSTPLIWDKMQNAQKIFQQAFAAGSSGAKCYANETAVDFLGLGPNVCSPGFSLPGSCWKRNALQNNIVLLAGTKHSAG